MTRRGRKRELDKMRARIRAAGIDSAAVVQRACESFGLTRQSGETISALCARTVGMTTEQYLGAMGLMLEGYTSAEAERMVKGGASTGNPSC